MPVWTADPQDLTVTHDDTVFAGGWVTCAVQVESGGNPVDGATVCLWKEGDVYEVEQTLSGIASFGFAPANAGTLLVTVVGRNYLPYEGEAMVVVGTSVPGGEQDIPASLGLASVCPNPFNPTVEVTYSVPAKAGRETVKLQVYTITGRCIRTLVNGEVPPGVHKTIWDGKDAGGVDAGSGVYFCELSSGSERRTKRIVLVR
jgi:hypothetical protein